MDIREEFGKSDITFNQKILIAVSGGVDSMVLWDLIHKSKRIYGVAHVNFNLRGEASKLDESLVIERAKELKIPCHTIQYDTNEYAKEQGISIQMAARELRYDFFKKLFDEQGYDCLATAHHLQDNIETFLLNLNRGTGIKGLSGISSTKQRFRPLLQYTKAEIRTFAAENNIAFREDKTNEDTKYDRNWFRHEVVAKWQGRNPNFFKTMSHNLSHIQDAYEVVEQDFKKKTKSIKATLKNGYINISDVENLKKKKYYLFEILSKYGFNSSHIESILKCIKNNQVGKVFHAKEYSIYIDRKKLILKEGEFEVSEKKSTYLLNTNTALELPLKVKVQNIETFMYDKKSSKNIEVFDSEKLKFPLTLRKWEQGDKMKPLGMKGSKKISDILIDLKIPLSKKNDVYVITSENKIVWLVGIRIDERFKVKKNSSQLTQITVNG